jgi:hypothetical protein
MHLDLVNNILQSQHRVFHSENELVLQFAYNLAAKQSIPADMIYFERSFPRNYITRDGLKDDKGESYLDMMVIQNEEKVGFEFKFSTKKLSGVDAHGVGYNLKEHSANDVIRYSFRKDIYRLEQMIKTNEIKKGFAILLTNDINLVKPKLNQGCLDDNYRFADKICAKDGGWLNQKYADNHWTKKGDKNYLLDLNKDYPVVWQKNACEYSFWYCIIEVN